MNFRTLLLFLLLPNLAYSQADSLELPVVKLSPIAITKRYFQTEYRITYITLANGLQVALRPTTGDSRYPADTAVYVKIERPHQPASYTDADRTALRVGGYLVRKAGIANLNGNKLSQYLRRNKINLVGTGNRFSTGINLQTGRSQLETALRVLHAFFTQPSSDTSAYQLALNELIADYRRPQPNPSVETIISDSIRHVLYCSGDRLVADDLLAVNPTQVYGLVKQAYGDASQFRCTMTGNFDLETAIGWLQQYLGNLPSTNRPARPLLVDDCSFPITRLRKVIYASKATTAVVNQVFLVTYRTVKPGDIKLVEALAYILRKRLNERLLQNRLSSRVLVRKESGGIVNGTSRRNRRVGISIMATCKPTAVDSINAIIRAELNHLVQTEIADSDLVEFKNAESQQNTLMKENGYLWNLILWSSIFADKWPIQSNAGALPVSPATLRKTARSFATTKDVISLTFLPESGR